MPRSECGGLSAALRMQVWRRPSSKAPTSFEEVRPGVVPEPARVEEPGGREARPEEPDDLARRDPQKGKRDREFVDPMGGPAEVAGAEAVRGVQTRLVRQSRIERRIAEDPGR